MKEGYRRLLVLTIVILSAFLFITGTRLLLDDKGLLDFIKNSGPSWEQARHSKATLPTDPAIDPGELSILSQLNDQYTRLSAACMPSVVSINTEGLENKRVRDRFGRISTQRERTMGQGSGVIVSYEGHVITNYHVVANKDQIKVTTADGALHLANLIGTDSQLDIAVLQLEGDGPFQPLKFGDSDPVSVGNIVLAIGNPYGIGKSITQGVISARERSISDLQGELLQSSAAINPGYSGGPLINIKGEIIGINSSIYSTDEKHPGFQGISFSIPSNIVKRTFHDIIKRGKPVRGFLGIASGELTQRVRSELGYDKPMGALISSVGKTTPADEAGLKPKDIIISYDNRFVRDANQLIGFIQRSEIGKEVKLQIWRNQKEMEIVANIEDYDQGIAQSQSTMEKIEDPSKVLNAVGIRVSNLTIYHRRQGINGVIVTQVQEGSLAAGLIEPGDIIYQLNGQQIHQSQQFYHLLLMSSTQGASDLFIIRDGEVHQKPIILPPVNQL